MLNLQKIRTKYKDRMLMLAFTASGWSPAAAGKQHGCVLAVDGKYAISIGFNGPDRDKAISSTCPCDGCENVHAEVNALLNLRDLGLIPEHWQGRLVAYVTKKPCQPCADALILRGVVAIFWLQDCAGDSCFWEAGKEVAWSK